MSSAIDWQPDPAVVVAGDGTGFEAAATALVRSLGFDATPVPEAELSRCRPRLVIVRDELALARAVRAQNGGTARFVVLMAPPRESRDGGHHRVHRLSGTGTADELGRLLHAVGGDRRGAPDAVHLTRRELEVVGDYVLGANVPEVAARRHIAPSTVKAHYRRVAARYAQAGRPVQNKTRLLLEMLADGWLTLPGHE